MSQHPTANRSDHDTFCTIEGWALVRGASGKPVRHHRTYKLILNDGRVLRTRISKPVDSTDYPKSMWATILRDQLDVTADEFWECVHNKVVPQRGQSVAARPGVPYYLFEILTTKIGMKPDEVAGLSEAEAQECVARYWSTPPEGNKT